MIAAKLGDVGVVGDEVIQEVCELVARAQYHVAALQVLVNDSQVEVVAEGVNVHQVPHLITLFSEEHGELERTEGGGHSHFKPRLSHRGDLQTQIHLGNSATVGFFFWGLHTHSMLCVSVT